jgi:hypothetical protein
MSKEEKIAYIRDMYCASMMDLLDINHDEKEEESYRISASKKAIVDLYMPSFGETGEEHAASSASRTWRSARSLG